MAASKSVKTVELEFDMDKETKNTVRFAEQTDGTDTPMLKYMYVQKERLKPLGNPRTLSVTITAVKS